MAGVRGVGDRDEGPDPGAGPGALGGAGATAQEGSGEVTREAHDGAANGDRDQGADQPL